MRIPCAMFGSLLIAFSAAATQGTAPTVKTCTIQSEGKAFLAAASERGLDAEQKTACHRVAIADNVFYAKPATPCELLFANGTWLAANAKFERMRGQGKFAARVRPEGIEVTIRPAGGFYLNQVTIAVTGKFKTCAEVQLDDVLGGG